MDLILDENIIVFAAKMENEEGKYDRLHAKVLYDILDRCDKIHCSEELYQKYISKLDSLEKAKHRNSYAVTRVLMYITRLGKMQMHTSPPPLDAADEKKIPPDDIFLIRLGAMTKAIIVTSDCRLRDRLQQERILVKYRLTVKKPAEIKN